MEYQVSVYYVGRKTEKLALLIELKKGGHTDTSRENLPGWENLFAEISKDLRGNVLGILEGQGVVQKDKIWVNTQDLRGQQ